jgi:hypothetical protein
MLCVALLPRWLVGSDTGRIMSLLFLVSEINELAFIAGKTFVVGWFFLL